MSRRPFVSTKREIARMFALACLLVGCGRVGVRVIGFNDSGRPDAAVSSMRDAATGGTDAAVPDSGLGYLGCPTACLNAHGSADCTKGSCVLTCAAGFADCDGSPADGCETDTRADPRHCGGCARSCDTDTQRCVSSTCELSPCDTGRGECDGNPALACETDLTSSAANCGFCGNDCAANGGGMPICNAGVCESHCDLNGVFALRLLVPTTWPSTSVLSGGSGNFVVWAKLQITHSGTNLLVQTTPCGQTVPDFSATAVINEKYGVTYPTALFDRVPALASVSGTGSLSGTVLGSSFSIARSAWMVGASMSDPLNDAWPALGSVMQVDADADSKVGVTLPYKSGSGYASPPVNSLGSTRANRVYLAARVVFSLTGTLTSCSAWNGSASVPDVDSHSIGCRTSGGGDCGGGEFGYLDSNAPNYQTQPSTFAVTKLASGAVCSDVRAALP